MDEAFRGGATDVDQAVERIVVIAAVAFAAVVDTGKVAVGVVSIAALGANTLKAQSDPSLSGYSITT